MAEPTAQQLLKQAIQVTKKGDLETARKLVQASIRKDPTSTMAWLVYASIAETRKEKLLCLRKVLELDPKNAQAVKMIRDLGYAPEKVLQTSQMKQVPKDEPTDATEEEAEREPDAAPPQQTDAGSLFSFQKDEEAEQESTPDYLTYTEETVKPPPPLVDEDDADPLATAQPVDATPTTEPPRPEPRPASFQERLEQAIQEVNAIVAAYNAPAVPPQGVRWVKKEKNRAAENEIVVVRLAAATAFLTFIVLPLGVVGYVIYNTPFFQGLLQGESFVAQVRTLTPTPTPPTTPTNTPGFTPTASPTATPPPENANVPTASPTATVFGLLRPGNPDINFVEPTEVFLPGGLEDRAVRGGIELIEDNQADVAIATLQARRDQESTTFSAVDALAYYTEALALIDIGEAEEALELLVEADQIREDRTRAEDTTSLAVIQAGLALTYVELGIQEQQRGATNAALGYWRQAETSANEAIQFEEEWAAPRLALIDSLILQARYTNALAALDEVLEISELVEDVRFLVRRGQIYFLQEDYDQAAYEAFVALYVDPISAEAHDLRTRIALAQGNAGDASIFAQTYLYYHPLVVEGWEMLGQVRELETNTSLALEAYTQAIVIGENTTQPLALDAYLARANIYESRGQYALAAADVAAAAAITEDGDLLRRAMYLTFEAGDYTAVREQAEALREAGEITGGEAGLLEARIILATRENLSTGDYSQVANLIDGGFGTLPPELQPLANLLRAEAYYEQGNLEVALNHAESALAAEETARVRLVRGKIFEESGAYAEALLEYERVLTLAQLVVVPEELQGEAEEGIRRADNLLAEERQNATATAQAN